jgi:2-polyprenyl-3-methyl-5-hydroxy-6-metoxy-1,4-benzoquinol methylase
LRGEKKYKINTTSFNNLARFNITGNQLAHATEYMPVSYFTMEQLLFHLPEKALAGTFLDIGCGKGRAMCVAAHYGFSKVKGIDFAEEMIHTAEKNLRITKQHYPQLEYDVLWKDVTALEIGKDVSTVFLFNPFDEVLMKTVIQKITASLQDNPRPFYVLYASPRHEELFFAKGFDVIYRVKKFNYLEGAILRYPEK